MSESNTHMRWEDRQDGIEVDGRGEKEKEVELVRSKVKWRDGEMKVTKNAWGKMETNEITMLMGWSVYKPS